MGILEIRGTGQTLTITQRRDLKRRQVSTQVNDADFIPNPSNHIRVLSNNLFCFLNRLFNPELAFQ